MTADRSHPSLGRATPTFFLALVLFACGAAVAQEAPVPDGYRMSEFRAPVPASVPGGITVDTARVRELIAKGDAVLIDVLPRPPRPAGLAADAVWAPKARNSLPGAIWLPNVGFGALSDEMHEYFSGHLARMADEMPAAHLIIFCEPNCWMSWNAAKRAAEWGYERVYWYPEGAGGWQEAGFELEAVEPADPLK